MSDSPKSQALLWPQLVYAMAQIAGKPDDSTHRGRIWVESIDTDHLRVFACDGVALLAAKVPATHTLQPGQIGSLLAADHKKKPSTGCCNQPELFSLEPWQGAQPPIAFDRLKPMLQGKTCRGHIDPSRLAAFFKALSALCSRVEVKVLPKATFARCPHPQFEGDIRGALANLAVKPQ